MCYFFKTWAVISFEPQQQLGQLCVMPVASGLLSGFVAGLDLLKQSYMQNFLIQTNKKSDKDNIFIKE